MATSDHVDVTETHVSGRAPVALDVSGTVEIAVLERSGLIESRHLGAAIVLAADGSTITQLGDADALIYPRSCLKLVQAVGLLSAGLTLEGEQLVLAAASHIGTTAHVGVVRDILAGAGLTEDDLGCPRDWPLDSTARRAATAPARITMNCSGKHAAFLATCVAREWPLENYLDPEHPLQRHLRATVEEYTGEPVHHVGVDGCGAPVFAVTLRGLATAISRIAAATPETDEAAARVADAIRADAWALDSPTTARVIRELGLVAKGGAEAVYVAASADGTAIALKVLDGAERPMVPVALSLLSAAGAVDAEKAAAIVAETRQQVLGAGLPVGELRSVV